MNNAEIFVMPLHAKVVTEDDTEALDRRRLARLQELSQQGWKPSSGWATEEPSDGPRSA